MQHRGHREATRLPDALGHSVDGRAAVPHLIDDQHALPAASAGNWKNRRRAGLASVVVVLDGGDEDVPEPESIGQHPSGHHPAARDGQHHVERPAGEPVGKVADELVEGSSS